MPRRRRSGCRYAELEHGIMDRIDGPAPDDTPELQRCIRDLVALSALPAVWKSYDQQQIAGSVAEALITMLDAEFVYVSLRGIRDEPLTEITRTGHHARLDAAALARAALADGLASRSFAQTREIRDPLGSASLRLASAPIGIEADAILVAASRRGDFPSRAQRLLIGVAAGQAAFAMLRWRAERDERRLVMLAERSSDFIGVVSLGGVPQYINPAGLKLVGLDALDEPHRTRIVDFVAPSDHARLRDEVWPAVLQAGRWVGELRLRDFSSGAAIPCLVDWFHIDDPRTGQPMNIATVGRDLRVQRHAEAELRRLAAIVESSNDAIIGTTLDGVITTWNRGAERTFGYRAAEVIGRSVSILAVPHREDEMPQILEQIRLGRKIEHYETVRRHKDGMPIAVSLTVSPIRDIDGSIIGASKIARDVTERQRAEAALLGLNQELEQRVAERTAALEDANRRLRVEIAERERADARLHEMQSELFHAARLSAMGQMAAALAHELNQPFTAAGNFVAAARRRLVSGQRETIDAAREDMDDAAAQVLRAGEIIHRQRAFVTRGETERRPESIARMIEEASALALTGMHGLGVELRFRFDPDVSEALADRVQIQQVLVNLMRNAVEAMTQSERHELDVVTRLIDQDTVEIAIADTGPGLAADVVEHLFDPFVSTKRNGMGLGLSICRSIVEAHGGRIDSEPNPGGGTIFRFTLVAVPAGEASDEA
jgi:two-component system, LuxR family, sensor kinase FixL